MMDMEDMPASPAAIRSCAPYGISPWTRHEKVSSMLALLRGSSSNRFEISRAMPPVVMIAIVLFAVHRFARNTNAAMLNSAPRLSLILLVRISTM